MDNKFTYRKDINLLDRVNDKALKSNIKGTFAIVIAIIVVFLILASIFIPKMIVSSKKTELEGLNATLQQVQKYEVTYNGLNSDIKVYNKKKDELESLDNGGVTKVLKWLETVVPAEGVNIKTLEIVSDSVITITGVANDENTIADFYVTLDRDQAVKAVAVSGAQSEMVGDVEVMGFTIVITYEING